MMRILKKEQEAEHKRSEELVNVSDQLEEEEIKIQHGKERTQAQKKIKRMMQRHEQEIKELEQQL